MQMQRYEKKIRNYLKLINGISYGHKRADFSCY